MRSLVLFLLLSGSIFYAQIVTAQTPPTPIDFRLDASVYAIANAGGAKLRPPRQHNIGLSVEPTFSFHALQLSLETHITTSFDDATVLDPELKLSAVFGDDFQQTINLSVLPLATSDASRLSGRRLATALDYELRFQLLTIDFELGATAGYHDFKQSESTYDTVYDLFPAAMASPYVTAVASGNVVFPWQLGVHARARWQLPGSLAASFAYAFHERLGAISSRDKLSGVSRISRYPRLQRVYTQLALSRAFEFDRITLVPTVGWLSVFAPKTADNQSLRFPIVQSAGRLADGGPFMYLGLRYPLTELVN